MAYGDGANSGETGQQPKKLTRAQFLQWGAVLGGAAVATATGLVSFMNRLPPSEAEKNAAADAASSQTPKEQPEVKASE